MERVAERSRALDVARGLAIVGVVFNHAVDGLVGAEVLDTASPVAQVNAALYVFRMPALVFLVGLFIPSGVAKRGAPGYIRGRVVLLVYLYLVWQVLQGLVESATSSVRNGTTRPVDILMIWEPLAHLWFLPFLALATALVAPWVASRRRPVLWISGIVVFAAITLVAWAAPLAIAGIRGIALVGFLAAGAALGLRRAIPLLAAPRWVWALVGVGASAGFVALLAVHPYPATLEDDDPRGLLGNALSIAAASLGIVALLALAVLIAALHAIGPLLSHLGRYTLSIYLAHIVVVAGGRVVLAALGVEDPYVLLVVLIPLGVVVPYLLARVAPRLRVEWLFSLPSGLQRLAASTASDSASRRRGESTRRRVPRRAAAHRLAE